jgi:hypothetical protein
METWECLLEKAVRYIKNSTLPPNTKKQMNWNMGGGTVLMMEYRHRLSKDIDIFLYSPQFLGCFSPRLNEMIEREVVHYSEQAEYIKLRYDEGEIDFIAAVRLLDKPYKVFHKFDTDIPCESPLEIIAKKVTYRHQSFATRDFFDLATVLYYSNKMDVQEIRSIFEPYADSLRERFLHLGSFDEIQTLPEGEIIRENGKTILQDFWATI